MKEQTKSEILCRLRDDAFEMSREAHDRMAMEVALYENQEYGNQNWLHKFKMFAQKSMNPKVRRSINRMLPLFQEQMPRIEVQSIKENRSELDLLYIEDLSNWLEKMEDADNEYENLKLMVYHNLVLGNVISKTWYDWENGVVRCTPIDPTNFAPDGACSSSDWKGAQYLVHSNWHKEFHVKMHYKDADLRDVPVKVTDGVEERRGIRVDEMWLRPHFAKEVVGIKTTERTNMVKVILVNNRLYRARGNLYWWPDFPFNHWSNFLEISLDGKPKAFWGSGYGTFLEPQQRLMDEMIANYIYITRNLAVGRLVTQWGALDYDQLMNAHGANIELNENYSPGDQLFLPPSEAPVTLTNMISLIDQVFQDELPSLSGVFIGEQDSAESGRALAHRQSALFNQLAGNVRTMNEFRRNRVRQRINLIQQFGSEHRGLHQWRLGANLPKRLPNACRNLPFDLVLPDVASIPNTPVGRLQIVEFLARLGLPMKQEKLLEFLNLDRGFGITEDSFWSPSEIAMMQMQGGGTVGGQQAMGAGQNADVAMGAEPNMRGER